MDKKTKELIDSFISYMKTGELQGCFKRISKSLEKIDLRLVVGRIIHWQYFLARGQNIDLYKFNPYEEKNNAEKILYPIFKTFFDSCKDVNKVFTLTKIGVKWNESISDDLKQKIITYIDENYEVPRSI